MTGEFLLDVLDEAGAVTQTLDLTPVLLDDGLGAVEMESEDQETERVRLSSVTLAVDRDDVAALGLYELLTDTPADRLVLRVRRVGATDFAFEGTHVETDWREALGDQLGRVELTFDGLEGAILRAARTVTLASLAASLPAEAVVYTLIGSFYARVAHLPTVLALGLEAAGYTLDGFDLGDAGTVTTDPVAYSGLGDHLYVIDSDLTVAYTTADYAVSTSGPLDAVAATATVYDLLLYLCRLHDATLYVAGRAVRVVNRSRPVRLAESLAAPDLVADYADGELLPRGVAAVRAVHVQIGTPSGPRTLALTLDANGITLNVSVTEAAPELADGDQSADFDTTPSGINSAAVTPADGWYFSSDDVLGPWTYGPNPLLIAVNGPNIVVLTDEVRYADLTGVNDEGVRYHEVSVPYRVPDGAVDAVPEGAGLQASLFMLRVGAAWRRHFRSQAEVRVEGVDGGPYLPGALYRLSDPMGDPTGDHPTRTILVTSCGWDALDDVNRLTLRELEVLT